jgi:hypothetical protein
MTDLQYYCIVSTIFLVGSQTATDKNMRTLFGIAAFVCLATAALSKVLPAVF